MTPLAIDISIELFPSKLPPVLGVFMLAIFFAVVLRVNARTFFADWFDPLIKTVLGYTAQEEIRLNERLKRENDINNHNKPEATQITLVAHLAKLLEINHQRVSASIAHSSIMVTSIIFLVNRSDDRFIGIFAKCELLGYLSIIILLLRCTRDFGLDADHDESTYMQNLLPETSYRFAILSRCNLAIVFLAVIFGGLLVCYSV